MSLGIRKERVLGCLQEGQGHEEELASVFLKMKAESFIFFPIDLWFFLLSFGESDSERVVRFELFMWH
jgi:hypothetical protein